MKKSIIAGASVLALAGAVMPMAGVFAANGDTTVITDTLRITVDDTCTFSATTGGADTGTFNQTYTDIVINGGTAWSDQGESATHIFGVVCNNDDGWTVTASAPLALSASGVDTKHNINYTAAALPSSQQEGAWNAVVSGTPVDTAFAVASQTGITEVSNVKYISTGGGIIAKENDSTDGSTFTVAYGAYVGTETPAGTYTATTSVGADGKASTDAEDAGDGGTIDYTLAAI